MVAADRKIVTPISEVSHASRKERPLDLTPPAMLDLDGRVRLTLSCRDADLIPRVPEAGKVSDDPETGETIQYMHNGLKVVSGGYYGDWMRDLIAGLKGVHEPQEEVVFHSLLECLPEKANMVEIGAFWSYFTIWFLSECPGMRRGVALEMDPAHIEIGRRNAALNGVEIEFVQGRIGTQDAPPAVFETESSGSQEMPSFGLAGLLDHVGLQRADLLLCDAQGGEIEMLSGMKALVDANRVGIAVISTHHHAITGDPLTHQRTIHLVETLGGKVVLEHDVSESFSGDGLVVADFGGHLADWRAPRISRCRAGASLFRNPLFDLADAQQAAVPALPAPVAHADVDPNEHARLVERVSVLERELEARLDELKRARFSLGAYLKHRKNTLRRSIAKRLGG
jgi:FkbM family methyltransferase